MNISKPIKYAVDNDDDNFIHKKDTLQIMTTNKQQNLNLRMSVESNIDIYYYNRFMPHATIYE